MQEEEEKGVEPPTEESTEMGRRRGRHTPCTVSLVVR